MYYGSLRPKLAFAGPSAGLPSLPPIGTAKTAAPLSQGKGLQTGIAPKTASLNNPRFGRPGMAMNGQMFKNPMDAFRGSPGAAKTASVLPPGRQAATGAPPRGGSATDIWGGGTRGGMDPGPGQSSGGMDPGGSWVPGGQEPGGLPPISGASGTIPPHELPGGGPGKADWGDIVIIIGGEGPQAVTRQQAQQMGAQIISETGPSGTGVGKAGITGTGQVGAKPGGGVAPGANGPATINSGQTMNYTDSPDYTAGIKRAMIRVSGDQDGREGGGAGYTDRSDMNVSHDDSNVVTVTDTPSATSEYGSDPSATWDWLKDLLMGGGTTGADGQINADAIYQTNPADQEFAQMVYDTLLSGGGPSDFMGAFLPTRKVMEEQVNRGAADVLEQFGNMGAQYGSGAITGVSDFVRGGTADINAKLADLAFQASESQAGRQSTGAQKLADMLFGAQENTADRMQELIGSLAGAEGDETTQQNALLTQLGQIFQGIDQQGLDRYYQDWLQQIQGFRPEILQYLSGGAPAYGTGSYEPGAGDQILPIITSMIMMAAMSSSDRDAKRNITRVPMHDKMVILKKLQDLPVSRWMYKDIEGKHMGPMAQDFAKAFRLGISDKVIMHIDMFGILLAGLQALSHRVALLESRI